MAVSCQTLFSLLELFINHFNIQPFIVWAVETVIKYVINTPTYIHLWNIQGLSASWTRLEISVPFARPRSTSYCRFFYTRSYLLPYITDLTWYSSICRSLNCKPVCFVDLYKFARHTTMQLLCYRPARVGLRSRSELCPDELKSRAASVRDEGVLYNPRDYWLGSLKMCVCLLNWKFMFCGLAPERVNSSQHINSVFIANYKA
jgi:hypothetical protein